MPTINIAARSPRMPMTRRESWGHTIAGSRTECEGQTVGDDDLTRTNRLIQAGSDIVGSVSGAGLGLLIAGPPGALAGAGMAPVLTTLVSMGAEFAQRRLSPRELTRVGALIEFTSRRVRELSLIHISEPTRLGMI